MSLFTHRLLLLSLSSLSLLVMASCNPKKDDPPPKPLTEEFFVNGDPMEMIRGATLNPESPFHGGNFESLNDYTFLTLQNFKEREKTYAPKTQAESEKDNSAATESRSDKLKEYRKIRVGRKDGNVWVLSMLKDSAYLEFHPDTEGRLQPIAIVDSKQTSKIAPLHWSVANNGKAISLLFRYENQEDGKGLYALYFEKKSDALLEQFIDRRFLTLDGPGSGTRWKTPELKIELCGSPEILAETQTAIAQWQGALGNRMKLNFEATSRFAPFSDLNQHCIHFLRTLKSQTAGGFAIPIYSSNDKEIFASDIFMYATAEENMHGQYRALGLDEAQTKANVSRYRNYAIVHELGHHLGLDHQFDGTPSIMSYSFNVTQLTTYDRDAIQALYKTK